MDRINLGQKFDGFHLANVYYVLLLPLSSQNICFISQNKDIFVLRELNCKFSWLKFYNGYPALIRAVGFSSSNSA